MMEYAPLRKLPLISSVVNVEVAGVRNKGRAGQMVKIKGARLSFEPGDTESGVFLVAPDTTEYRMSVYSRAGTTHIDFKVAEVPAGTYTLEVRTRPTERDVWVGASDDPFTVEL